MLRSFCGRVASLPSSEAGVTTASVRNDRSLLGGFVLGVTRVAVTTSSGNFLVRK